MRALLRVKCNVARGPNKRPKRASARGGGCVLGWHGEAERPVQWVAEEASATGQSGRCGDGDQSADAAAGFINFT